MSLLDENGNLTEEGAQNALAFLQKKAAKQAAEQVASEALADLLFEGLTIGDFGPIATCSAEIVKEAMEMNVQINPQTVMEHLNQRKKEFIEG